MGIKQCLAAEENLNMWFRAQKPQPPHPGMSESCLYYQPCEDDDNGRFIIIISTPEQQAMAWQYGHNNLLLLDGMFGVNSARSLLFIGMVIDAEWCASKCYERTGVHCVGWTSLPVSE